MKFVVRRAVLLAVVFHLFAYLYVVEILRNKDGDKDVATEERDVGSASGEFSSDAMDNRTQIEEVEEKVVSLEDRIKGIENILQPSVSALVLYRINLMKQKPAKVQWNNIRPTANRLHGDDYHLLHVVSQEYSQIQIVPTVAVMENLAQYLLPYYYPFSSNMCSAPMFQQKGSKNNLQWIYNATCKTHIADTMKPVPLKYRSRALRIWNFAGYLKDPSKVVITYLNIVPYAIADRYGDVTTSNISLVPQRCDQDKYWRPSSPPDKLPYHDEVFTIHQMYGRDLSHNALENLARLAPYVVFLRNNPNIMVHAGFSNPYLELLTITPKRVVSDGVRARTVYMPAGTLCEAPSLLNTQLMSFYLRQGLHNNQQDRNVVLLLKDSSQTSEAYLKLYSQVFGMARQETQQKGLTLVPFTDIIERSLATTRELFNRAIVVLAPRSTASIVHMYFSQPGTALIEGLCQTGVNTPPSLKFAAFSQALGLRYHAVLSDTGCSGQAGVNEFKMALRFYLSKLHMFTDTDL